VLFADTAAQVNHLGSLHLWLLDRSRRNAVLHHRSRAPKFGQNCAETVQFLKDTQS